MTEISRRIQPTIAFRNAAFDTTDCEKFCLALRINGPVLSLVVLDNLTNDFLAFEEYEFKKVSDEKEMALQLEHLFSEHPWLMNGFKRTDAMIVTERFTHIPSAFFDSSKQLEFLKFNHPVSDKDEVHSENLRNADARLIFAIHSELGKVLHKLSVTVRIHHHLYPLTERVLSLNKNKTGKRATINIQKERFDLVISEGGKLLLSNTFNHKTAEDLTYYLLFSCEQLKMNADQLELDVFGELQTDSASAMLLRKYIRNVSFGSRPEEGRFAKEFDSLPPHFYYPLFLLHYYS